MNNSRNGTVYFILGIHFPFDIILVQNYHYGNQLLFILF